MLGLSRFGDREGSRLHVAGQALFAVVVPLSALALGSIKPLTLAIMGILAAASTALLWATPLERLSHNSILILCGVGALTAVTALQILPLPTSVVRAVAPVNADLWSRALLPFNEPGPTWHMLSVDPVATRVQVTRGLFYLCIFLGALRLMGDAQGSQFLELVVIASGVVMAFVALAHPAVGAQRLFGVYTPRELYAYQTGHYAPLLNVNHLTAYLNIGVCVALARLLRAPQRRSGALLVAALLLMAGTSVWAGSRGGMLGLALGCGITIVLSHLSKRRWSAPRSGPFEIGSIVALGGVLLLAIGLSENARSELGNLQTEKLEVARAGLRLVSLSPWLGVGRGGFESIFPLVQEVFDYETSTHPENIIVEWAVEWGVPLSLGAASTFLWALRPREMLTRVTPAPGAWAAIVATIVHDFVDFHLEVPGVTALIMVCIAVVVGRRGSSNYHEKHRRFQYGLWAATAVTVVAAIAIVPLEGKTVADDRIALSKLALDRSLSREEFRGRIHDAVTRHPAEAFLPLMGAVRAQAVDDERVLPWISSALEKNPRFGRAHFVLAGVLGPRNPGQARLEYRLAWLYDGALRNVAITEGARWVDSFPNALELVVDGVQGIPVLERLAVLVGERLPSTASQIDNEILRRDPNARGPLVRAALAVSADIENDEPWCIQPACGQDAIRAAEAAVAVAPDDCNAHLLLAKARAHGLDGPKAIDDLVRATSSVPNRLECKKQAAVFIYTHGERAQASTLIDEISRFSCTSDKESADRFEWLGRYEEERGHDARAITFYKRAIAIEPDRDSALRRIFTIASRTGLHSDAASAADAMARRYPNEPEWSARRDQARARALLDRMTPTKARE